MHYLRKMGRAYFFFAFTDEHEIHRQLYFCLFERAQSAKKGGFRTLLIHCTATNADFAQSLLIDDLSFKGRRGPLRRIKLLHVVHEVDADGRGRASVESSEDSGLTRGGHNFNIGEA